MIKLLKHSTLFQSVPFLLPLVSRTYIHLSKLVLTLTLICLLFSCTKETYLTAEDTTTKTVAANSLVKVFDLTSLSPVYSVLVTDPNNKTSVLTPYIDVNYDTVVSGKNYFKVQNFRSGSIVNTNNFVLSGGEAYTAFVYHQTAASPGISIIKDDLTEPAHGFAKIRLLYTEAGNVTNSSVNLSIKSNTNTDSLTSLNRTNEDFIKASSLASFNTVKTGTYSLWANNQLIFNNNLQLASGRLFTVVITKQSESSYSATIDINK